MHIWQTIIMVGALTTLGAPALAFHAGGAANCDGCHAAHPGAAAGSFLLAKGDASSVCLACHQVAGPGRDHAVASGVTPAGQPPRQLTPGGDFAWLRKDYRWQGRVDAGRPEVHFSPGERHGHNVVARDFGLVADTSHVLAPGGAYPAAALGCTSCHDPHGRYRRLADGSIATGGPTIIAAGSYPDSPSPAAEGSVGSYRLLAGAGYQLKSLPQAPPFVADPPVAVAPRAYNRSEAESETRVAYGSGMSDWCRNCHSFTHTTVGEPSGHPVGLAAPLTGSTASSYNSYVASGNLTGTSASAYTTLVPFELGNRDYRQLQALAVSDGSRQAGPGGEAGRPEVSCITCHRAHASAWDGAARWNLKSSLLSYRGEWPGIDNGAPADYAQGRTEAETRQGYYGRPASRFAYYQKSLCNKCHAKD